MSLIGLVIFTVTIVACVILSASRPTMIERYRFCIGIISLIMIPVSIINIASSVSEVLAKYSPAGPEATGLGNILDLIALAGLPIIVLYVSLIVVITHLAFVGMLWLIYGIWKTVVKKKEKCS